MAITKLTPRAVPLEASPNLRQWLDEQVQRMALLLNNAAQLEDELIPDALIAESNVTQHQAALTILESQITDGALLARLAENETVAGSWTFTNAVAIGAAGNQIGPAESILSRTVNGAATMDIDAIASDNTSSGAVRVNRNLNTSGLSLFSLMRGNDSTAAQVQLRAFGTTNGGGAILIRAMAAAPAHVATFGILWVKNTAPCQLWFTDDAGNDTQIV